MEVNTKDKENKEFLDNIGLIDSFIAEVPKRKSKDEKELIDRIINQVLAKVNNGTYKDKILNKINFLEANNHFYSTVGIPEDETGLLAVIYFEGGQYNLQYYNNNKAINLETDDTRKDKSLVEKITVTYKHENDNENTYIDYHYIFTNCYQVDGNEVKEVIVKSTSVVVDKDNKELFHRETTNRMLYKMKNGKEELVLEETFDANTKWRKKNEFYIIGNTVSKYKDLDRTVEENEYYITRNICPSISELTESDDKTIIDSEEFNELINNTMSIGEVMKKVSLKKTNDSTN